MGRLLAWLPALAVAVLMVSGCAEFYRFATLEDQQDASEEAASRAAEENARVEKQLEEMNQKIRQMADTVERMSKTVTALSERMSSQEQVPAEPQASRDRRRAAGGAARAEANAECAWVGQRVITVLLNDDLIAAEGFTRLYSGFLCPMDHLAQAFACAVPSAQLKERALLDPPPAPKPGETTEQVAAARREAQLAAVERRDKRVAACWSNPRANSGG